MDGQCFICSLLYFIHLELYREISFHCRPAFQSAPQNTNNPSKSDYLPSNTYVHHRFLIFVLNFTPEPRRASVAIILRVVPSPNGPTPKPQQTPPTLTEFFNLDWVRDPNARPEILFLHRDAPNPVETGLTTATTKSNEGHVAFPGGRTEPEDEGGLYTGVIL